MCDRVFEEAFLSDYANISEAVFRTWFRHQELIETIVGIDRGDMLYASLRRCTSRMRSGLPESGDAALLDYLASIIASSMMGIMITWVERGKKENEEELKGHDPAKLQGNEIHRPDVKKSPTGRSEIKITDIAESFASAWVGILRPRPILLRHTSRRPTSRRS